MSLMISLPSLPRDTTFTELPAGDLVIPAPRSPDITLIAWVMM